MSLDIRSSRRRGAETFRHVDVVLLAAVAAITGLGMLMIYSSTRGRQAAAGLDPGYFLHRQAMFVAVGVAVMVLMMLVDYQVLRDMAPAIYAASVVALLLVVSPLGTNNRGAQAWFQIGPYQFQPAEFGKLALILALAAFCATHRDDLDTSRLATAIGIAALPLALIYLQPDVGTGMVFVAALMAIVLVGGASPRQILILTLLGVTGIVLVLELGVLKTYQEERLAAFLDPQEDVQRTAYNLNQSKTAIANGGLGGKGLFQGTQTNLSYVPEQHTDFIFTAVGEELGFVGAATLLAMFGLVMWRTWRAAVTAKDQFGTLVCVGILAVLVFQVFENVGMTMGITPIAGIPLPFMSYGGSSIIAAFAAVGLVLNVQMRRYS